MQAHTHIHTYTHASSLTLSYLATRILIFACVPLPHHRHIRLCHICHTTTPHLPVPHLSHHNTTFACATFSTPQHHICLCHICHTTTPHLPHHIRLTTFATPHLSHHNATFATPHLPHHICHTTFVTPQRHIRLCHICHTTMPYSPHHYATSTCNHHTTIKNKIGKDGASQANWVENAFMHTHRTF